MGTETGKFRYGSARNGGSGRTVTAGITALIAAIVCCAAAAGGEELADDYLWNRIGTKETEAVKSAVERGEVARLEALLADGLDADQLLPVGDFQIPPISLAAAAGRDEVVEFLIGQGADVDRMSTGDAFDQDRYTDRHQQLEKGERGNRPEVAELRLDSIEGVTYASPLMYAVAASSRKGARLLLQAEADVDMTNSGGVTALMMAAALNDRVMVNMLLAFGATVDDQAEDLSYLVPPGCREGSRTTSFRTWSARSGEGASAIWLAAFAGGAEVVKLLLAAHADPELEASCESIRGALEKDDSCTPRRAAELGGHPEVMALLP